MKPLRPYQQDAVRECWESLKATDRPVLLMASVGAGKSLMISSVLLSMQKAGKKALCIVNNAELVRNNCQTFIDEGGCASIYCAALGSKSVSQSVVFGTPQSILNGINKNEPIANVRFNLIVVDEAHAINFDKPSTYFMRILRHYKQEYPDMRVLGATGTNFRFKGTPIVGADSLFKSQVGNITTEWLIENQYLIEPRFEIDKELVIDFSKVKIKRNGQFDNKQLDMVISASARLTELICKQIIHIRESQNRFGVFIFATTTAHALEILSHLPQAQSALILGNTPQEDRTKILEDARHGRIKYLVNIAIISVGVDVPAYDTIAYLRPTESLVLLVQTMGRALRLSPNTNKTEALVLDFAGNIERHADWDNPILLDAVKKALNDGQDLCICCPQCSEMNTETARRCIGTYANERCSYYFQFKECHNCETQNDITARHCRACNAELIDPNDKLSLKPTEEDTREVRVLDARYGLSGTQRGFRINCVYRCKDERGRVGSVFEHYTPSTEKSQRYFYGSFVRKHCQDSSKWYPHLHKRDKVEEMLREIKTPIKLLIAREDDAIRIKRKYFD